MKLTTMMSLLLAPQAVVADMQVTPACVAGTTCSAFTVIFFGTWAAEEAFWKNHEPDDPTLLMQQQATFNEIDATGDGLLSKEEIQKWFKEVKGFEISDETALLYSTPSSKPAEGSSPQGMVRWVCFVHGKFENTNIRICSFPTMVQYSSQ